MLTIPHRHPVRNANSTRQLPQIRSDRRIWREIDEESTRPHPILPGGLQNYFADLKKSAFNLEELGPE